jgi:hypothetical protein
MAKSISGSVDLAQAKSSGRTRRTKQEQVKNREGWQYIALIPGGFDSRRCGDPRQKSQQKQ